MFMGRVWTEEENKIIIENYKEKNIKELQQLLPNRTSSAIYQRIYLLGLSKNENNEVELESEPVVTVQSEYNRVCSLEHILRENNERNLNDIFKWYNNLVDIIPEVAIGDRIHFGNGIFERVEKGFYCCKGVGSFISRDEMYPGICYSVNDFLRKVLDINQVLYNWGKELYSIFYDARNMTDKKDAFIKEEKESDKHKGRIEGTSEEKANEAKFRIEQQISGYVEKVIRQEKYTEVYTVEGGSHHIRYFVYDAGDIYVK